MGVIGKLAFWRKSSKKAAAVETFVAPPESPKGDVMKVLLGAELESSHIANVSNTDQHSDEVPSPEAAATSLRVQADARSDQHSPVPAVMAVSPVRSQVVVEGADTPSRHHGLVSKDADDLEAELCDEVEFLPEPKKEAETSLLGTAASSIDQEDISFDKSLEDVFAGVSKAFGPMIASSLQSPKWDKRAQALKAVGTMLRGLDLQGMAPPGSTGVLGKGLQLRDRAVCWRSCCELLHHVMRDKVMPVRLASHDLFQEAFGNADGLVSQEQCHFALDILIQPVIERLGDSNIRLHESARKCVFFCAERPLLLGLEDTLRRLKARLDACGKGGERQKVCNGILDTVNFLIQHFPGRRMSSRNLDDDDEEEMSDPVLTWTAADIAPFVAAGMDDSLGPRVRSTTIALAVTVYQTFGMEAVQPVLEGLRPAKQALLRQKFQESEDLEPEDFARSTLCGTTSSTMATPTDCITRTESFGELVVCGSAMKMPGSHPLLPDQFGDPDEENLMDGILEEAGMVFNGSCIVNENFGHDSRCLRPIPGLSRTLLEEDLEEEHRILEEELMGLGVDFDSMELQEVC